MEPADSKFADISMIRRESEQNLVQSHFDKKYFTIHELSTDSISQNDVIRTRESVIDYVTSSSSSSSSCCHSSYAERESEISEWTTTDDAITSEHEEELQNESAVTNVKSCCSTKELPSPITSKYVPDETTFLSSIISRGNASVLHSAMKGVQKKQHLHNCNIDKLLSYNEIYQTPEHANDTSGQNENSNNSNDNDNNKNDKSELNDHNLEIDLSDNEHCEQIVENQYLKRENNATNNTNNDDNEQNNESDDAGDDDDDHTSWAERQRATLMQMRLHIHPDYTPVNVNYNTSRDVEYSTPKIPVDHLGMCESNICNSSNDITPTHSSLYTTQPHVSNISDISPIKQEYTSFVTFNDISSNANDKVMSTASNDNSNDIDSDSDNVKIAYKSSDKSNDEDSPEIYLDHNTVHDFSAMERLGVHNDMENHDTDKSSEIESEHNSDEAIDDTVNSDNADLPEVKQMISELLQQLRSRDGPLKRSNTSFHIPGNDKEWQYSVAQRRCKLQREATEKELHECTFHPTISPGSRAIAALRLTNQSLTHEQEKHASHSVLSSTQKCTPSSSAIVESNKKHKYGHNIVDASREESATTYHTSVYDRLYALATTSDMAHARFVQYDTKHIDNIDTWRRHCNGFVRATSKNRSDAKSHVINSTPSEMRLFLSNVLNCECKERTCFDDLVARGVAVRTEYVSPMSLAYAELEHCLRTKKTSITSTITSNSTSNSINASCNAANSCNEEIMSDRARERFGEFWRRQQHHLARKAQTVETVKYELTPEFRPHTTRKSHEIVQHLKKQQNCTNSHDSSSSLHKNVQFSSLQLSSSSCYCHDSHGCDHASPEKRETKMHEAHSLTLMNKPTNTEQCNKRHNEEQVNKHEEQIHECVPHSVNSTHNLNTELVRQYNEKNCNAAHQTNSYTFKPKLSKGTLRLLASHNRSRKSSNECNNVEVVNRIDECSEINRANKKSSENDDINNNNNNVDNANCTQSSINNARKEICHDVTNISSSNHNNEEIGTSELKSSNTNALKTNKCKEPKRFELLYAQHQRVLHAHEAARERKAKEQVSHLTFKPHINRSNVSTMKELGNDDNNRRKIKNNSTNAATSSAATSTSAINETEENEDVSIENEKTTYEEVKERRSQERIYSLLSKENREHYLEIVAKRQQEREEQRAAALREKARLELSECTFKPQLTQLPEYIPRMRSNC